MMYDFQMHENKYLHLPVVDEESGTVLGAVNVMEIIQATAGEQGSTGYVDVAFFVSVLLCCFFWGCFICFLLVV